MQLFLKKVAFSFRNYREFPVILVKQGKMNRELNIAMDEAMLLRYFSGVLENEEKEQVETWISLSEENRKTAKPISCNRCCTNFESGRCKKGISKG